MEDTRSVCSGVSQGSVTNSKIECPHCAQEFQMKAIFNHIRIKHPREMITMTTKKFLEEANKGFPLCIYWTVKNDFDEEEESKLYVCLSTNKTFKTEERAILHFNKSPSDKKKHIQHSKMLSKEFQKEKMKKNVTINPYVQREKLMLQKNDPALAKALWRGILYHKSKIEIGLWFAEKQQLCGDYVCYVYREKMLSFEPTNWLDLQAKCKAQLEMIEMFYELKQMNCISLQKLWYSSLLLWSKDLKESLYACSNFDYSPTLWTEEFFFYANETMPEVEF